MSGFISIVVPVFNEKESIGLLYKEVARVMREARLNYELIFIDDGSTDGSIEELKKAAQADKWVKVIFLNKNFGQTAAMSAGFDLARGDVIIPLDADLQNDPAGIPLLLSKIDQGYDVVSGWRRDRQDKLFSRKIPSWLANWLISRITGVKLHDYGCSLKAYRRDVLRGIRLYGEMHRFIPAYASWYGAKVAEVMVNHRPRRFGKTKYGISRTFRVLLDLLTVKFLTKYSTKPMHFFGKIGFYSLFMGILSGILSVYLRLSHGVSFISTPLPLLVVFLCLLGVLFVLLGLLAEILIRVYYEAQGRTSYLIKEKMNFE